MAFLNGILVLNGIAMAHCSNLKVCGCFMGLAMTFTSNIFISKFNQCLIYLFPATNLPLKNVKKNYCEIV
jgi:hypothetical protein